MRTKFDWEFDFSGLPDISQEALKNYFLYALPPGGFLTSLLSNHPWRIVIGRADHWNKPLLGKYAEWLVSVAPPDSWGSEERVTDWLNKGPAYQAFQKTLMWETLSAKESDFE